MARFKISEEGSQSQEDGASNNMSARLHQIEATFSNSTSHFEDTNKIILQFFGEASKRVNNANSNIESTGTDVHALQQQAKGNITQKAACRAQGESHKDHLGQLERKYEEVVQANRILAQQAENLKAQQLLDKTSLQELREKVDEKLEQAVQPVTFSVPIVQQGYYLEAPQALTLDLEVQHCTL